MPVNFKAIAAHVIYDLLQALAFLRDSGVVHRDVKPQNLIFGEATETSHLKLIDFGLATRLASTDPPLKIVCGTLDYMSPECVGGQLYDHATDVWAAGVVLAMLLTGCHPFRCANEEETEAGIAGYDGNVAEIQLLVGIRDISAGARDLLGRMLAPDAALRPTARHAVKHPWLRTRSAPDAPSLPADLSERFYAQCYRDNSGVQGEE